MRTPQARRRARWASALAVVCALGVVSCAEVPTTTVAAPATPTPVPEPTPSPTPQVAVPGGTGSQLLVTTTGGVLLAGPTGVFQQVVTPGAGVRYTVDDGQGGLVVEIEGQGLLWLPADGSPPVRIAAGPGITLHDAAVVFGKVHIAYSTLDATTGLASAWLVAVDGVAMRLGDPDSPVVAMSIGTDILVVSRQDQASGDVTAWSEIWDGPESTITVPGIPGPAEACRPASSACPWMVTVSPDGRYFAVVTDHRDTPGESDTAGGSDTPGEGVPGTDGGAVVDVTVLDRAGGEPGTTISVADGFVVGARVAADRLVVDVAVFDGGRVVPGAALVSDLGSTDPVPVAVAGPAWQPAVPVVWSREAPLGLEDVIAALAP